MKTQNTQQLIPLTMHDQLVIAAVSGLLSRGRDLRKPEHVAQLAFEYADAIMKKRASLNQVTRYATK